MTRDSLGYHIVYWYFTSAADHRPAGGHAADGNRARDDAAVKSLSLISSGFALLVLGGFLLLGGLTYSSTEEVVRVGEFEVSASRERSVPTWVGVLSLAAGAGLLAGGLLVRRRA